MAKPIAIWLTDTHLSENTIEINKSIYTQVFSLCERLDVNMILHGGDVFDSRKGQPEIVLNTFKEILDQCASKQLKIAAISGNHDKTDGDSEGSFLDAFDGHPGFTVLQSQDVMKVDNIHFHALPYLDLSYHQHLSKVSGSTSSDIQDISILLTHVAIDGVKGNNGIEVQGELEQSLFDRFDKVLVGHYHDRQFLGSRQHIIYTGSAYQANFGEDVYKGCVVINNDGSIEFIELEFPQYITIEIIPNEDLDTTLVEKIKQKSKEANIRLKFEGDVSEDKKSLIAQLQSIGVKINSTKQSFVALDIENPQVSFTGNDILNIYDEWAKERQIEDPDFGRQVLTKVL